MNKKLTLLIATCVICLLAFTGCMRNTTPSPSNTPMTSPMSMTSPTTPLSTATPSTRPMTSPGTSPLTNPTADANGEDKAAVADQIKDEINKMSEVHASAVVVHGNTALIGVRYDDAYKGELTGRITTMIEEKAKQIDTALSNIVVTDDTAMIDEIEDMRANMSGGTLIGDIKAKFDSLINRIKPSA